MMSSPTIDDAAYDAERCEKMEARERLAGKRGVALQYVEDCLAIMQGSAYDRRVGKAQLAASRARLGW